MRSFSAPLDKLTIAEGEEEDEGWFHTPWPVSFLIVQSLVCRCHTCSLLNLTRLRVWHLGSSGPAAPDRKRMASEPEPVRRRERNWTVTPRSARRHAEQETIGGNQTTDTSSSVRPAEVENVLPGQSSLDLSFLSGGTPMHSSDATTLSNKKTKKSKKKEKKHKKERQWAILHHHSAPYSEDEIREAEEARGSKNLNRSDDHSSIHSLPSESDHHQKSPRATKKIGSKTQKKAKKKGSMASYGAHSESSGTPQTPRLSRDTDSESEDYHCDSNLSSKACLQPSRDSQNPTKSASVRSTSVNMISAATSSNDSIGGGSWGGSPSNPTTPDDYVLILVRCSQLPEFGEDFTEISLNRNQRTIEALRQALVQEFEVTTLLLSFSSKEKKPQNARSFLVLQLLLILRLRRW